MKHVIIGTAGHVDHGKTTLIQALTGTNPDRLKEEQERGMTIDIGFAALQLPDGTVAGIVDVPGHERFLKNMLAGASGVDVVLLVVAADESVMPQTREHLDILRLLDVKNGVVALTKSDLVDKEWTDIVEEDVRAQLQGSFLANAPILRVSAVTGKGLEALKKALLSAVSRSEARNALLPFRLPIDRVFTRPGFGTVVTGTLVAGTLRVGDAVEIVPQRLTSRVRGLQVHGKKVETAEAETRVAVNLAGIDTDALERGAQLISPASLSPTLTIDASIRLLPSDRKALKDRSRLRIHIGTAEVLGRIRLLDEHTELAPGANAYIQFRTDEPFVAQRGDRFVVRTYSPMTTIGGGVILDPNPARHRKNDTGVLTALQARERGTAPDLLETRLRTLPQGMLKRELLETMALVPAEVEEALTALLVQERIRLLASDRLIHWDQYTATTHRVVTALEAYHRQFPLRVGMPREELRAALGKEKDGKAFNALLAAWQEEGRLIQESATVRLAEFRVELNERQSSLLDRIEAFYRECGIATPEIEEVCTFVKAPPDAVNALLRVGVDRGRFQRIADGVYVDIGTLRALQHVIREQVQEKGSITVAGFRDLTQTNRRYALQALEHFDVIRFTMRRGDERLLGPNAGEEEDSG